MKILIDCGASNGSAIKELDNKYGTFDKIYAIEPNPENVRQINTENSRIVTLEIAISTAYGRLKLYLSERFDGSTLYPEKQSNRISVDRFIEVETIDFETGSRNMSAGMTMSSARWMSRVPSLMS